MDYLGVLGLEGLGVWRLVGFEVGRLEGLEGLGVWEVWRFSRNDSVEIICHKVRIFLFLKFQLFFPSF
jgi:hypothetical protein